MTRALTRLLVLFLALSSTGGGIAWLHARAAAPATMPAEPMPVEVMKIEPRDHVEFVARHTGRIEAARETTLAFEQSGLVVELLVDEGHRVEAGEPLARQDTELRVLERRRLEAERAATEAQIELARRTEDRQQALAGRGYSAAQAYDDARFQRQALEAGAAALDAAIARIDAELANATLLAPFAGTVAARHVDEGVVAAAGEPVLELLETDHLEARIGVPVVVATDLELGSIHRLEVDGRALDAVLTRKRPDLAGATRTVMLILELRPGAGTTPPAPGELATLLRTDQLVANGFWAPLAVLEQGQKGLWRLPIAVQDADGWRRRAIAVEILHAESDRVFVHGTVPPGARLLAAGAHRVPQGALLRPLGG